MTIGIYSIASPSGRKYIGQSINCEKRIRQHKHALRKGSHYNSALTAAHAKYEGKLEFAIVCALAPKDLDWYEQHLINTLGKASYNQKAVTPQGYMSDAYRAEISKRVRASRAANPTIGQRIGSGITAALKADPSINVKRTVKNNATKQLTRDSRMLNNGLLLYTKAGLRVVYNTGCYEYKRSGAPLPERCKAAEVLLRRIRLGLV